MTSDQPCCEPPEGWHWWQTGDGPEPYYCGPGQPGRNPETGYQSQRTMDKWTYLGPVTPPDIVRGLVEALEALIEAGVIPKSSAKEGGAMRFSSQVAAADLARAALARAKEAANESE